MPLRSILILTLLLGNIALAEPVAVTEKIALFNGKNLDNWYTFLRDRGRDSDPKKVFTVDDGELIISGEEWGCITTPEEYQSYKLVTEWRWDGRTFGDRAEKTRDSGIIIHSKGDDGGYNNTWMFGIECQIIEGGTGDFIVVGNGSEDYSLTCTTASEKQGSCFVYAPKGKEETINGGRINWWGRDPSWEDVIDFRGAQDVESPVGEWNRLECIVDGGKITTYLNGVLVNASVATKPDSGRLQVQAEGAGIIFRKIELHPLKEK